MAEDVKKSEVTSEPMKGPGAKSEVTDDVSKSAESVSAQKKKVRKRPGRGELKDGRPQKEALKKGNQEGEKTKKVRKKRPKPAEKQDTTSLDGSEPEKKVQSEPEKKVRAKKADPNADGVKRKRRRTGEKGASLSSKAPCAEETSAPKAPGTEETSAPKAESPDEAQAQEDGKGPGSVLSKLKSRISLKRDENGSGEKIDIKAGAIAVFGICMAFLKKLFKKIPLQSRKKILTILGIVLGVYIVFSFVFTFIFMPRTYLNGVKVGLKSYASSSKLIKPTIKDYVLTVQNLDGSEDHVEGSSVKLKYESMQWIKRALKQQNQFAWPISLFRKKEITIEEDVSYDEAAFAEILKKLSGFKTTTMIEPQDAHVAMDQTGNYVVFPEVLGTTIDVDAAKEAALECLLTGNRVLNLEEYHILPKVYSTDDFLGERLHEWNEYMKSAGLTYTFWDKPEVLTREVINSLISEGPDKLYVDEKKVMNLMSVWRERHDSIGRSFTFRTYDGIDVEIEPGGDYGYELNEEAVGADIIEKLNAHDTGTYDVSYWRKPLFTTNNGLGDTYIEISITDQHLWMYKDGQLLIDTNVVTGMPTDEEDRITHKGCYSVDWHEEHVLLGTMETRGYEQLVDYWIAFNQSEGIHDAQWRENSEYTQQMYIYDGSHGCVNTPLEAMKIIYENVIDGEAVVIY